MDKQSQIWKDFINRKFLEYQMSQGRRVTVSEFADAVSLPPAVNDRGLKIYQGDVSHWLKGTRIPGVKYLKALAKSPLVGPGVWEAAGFEFDVSDLDPVELQVIEAMRELPESMRNEFARQVEDTARRQLSGQSSGALVFQTQRAA